MRERVSRGPERGQLAWEFKFTFLRLLSPLLCERDTAGFQGGHSSQAESVSELDQSFRQEILIS